MYPLDVESVRRRAGIQIDSPVRASDRSFFFFHVLDLKGFKNCRTQINTINHQTIFYLFFIDNNICASYKTIKTLLYFPTINHAYDKRAMVLRKKKKKMNTKNIYIFIITLFFFLFWREYIFGRKICVTFFVTLDTLFKYINYSLCMYDIHCICRAYIIIICLYPVWLWYWLCQLLLFCCFFLT